jgi:hypothetical protein
MGGQSGWAGEPTQHGAERAILPRAGGPRSGAGLARTSGRTYARSGTTRSAPSYVSCPVLGWSAAGELPLCGGGDVPPGPILHETGSPTLCILGSVDVDGVLPLIQVASADPEDR